MFRIAIESTELSSNISDNIFPRITGSIYDYDATFLSTLRALLPSRMEEEDYVHLDIISDGYSERTVKSTPANEMVRNLIDGNEVEDGTIILYNLIRSQSDNYACLELLKSSFVENFHGWHRVEKFTDFFRKTFYSIAFINPEKKSVVMFTDGMDIRRFHYIQCAIPAILPWYFDPAKGLTELERALIESLRQTDAEQYKSLIGKFALQYDFRGANIRALLKGFETQQEEKQKERLSQQIRDLEHSIRRYSDEIASAISRKREKNIMLLGIIEKISQSEEKGSEIMEFFLQNDRFDIVSTYGDELTFTVKDYLEFFDPDMASSVINKNNSYIYDYARNYDRSDVKRLLEAIFVNRTIKLRFCAAYKIGLSGRVDGISGYDFDSNRSFEGYMPNPHIQGYGCIGDFRVPIQQFLDRFEYIGAIHQCAASCKNLNIADTTVMERFMRNLFSDNCEACLELPDGTVVKPGQAIDWINAQEGTSNE